MNNKLLSLMGIRDRSGDEPAQHILRPEAKPTVTGVLTPDGRTINVRQWRGRGTPLVLLHGLLDSAEGWDELARSTRRPVVAVDLSGFGGSDLPLKKLYRSYAHDVHSVLTALNIYRYILVGHSLGGGIATVLAARYPKQVRVLILLAPTGFGRIVMAEIANVPLVRTITSRGVPLALTNPLLVASVYAVAISNHKMPSHALIKQLERGRRRAGEGVRCAVAAICAGENPNFSFTAQGVKYRGPVHVLWGSRDQLLPLGHIKNLQRALPQAEVDVWDGMGHHPQVERPDLLADFIEATADQHARRTLPKAIHEVNV